MEFIRKNGWGILLCFAIALPAYLLSYYVSALKIIGGPIIAIIIGMIVAIFLKDRGRFQPGIGFTSKKILQTAVVLLGFGLNLATVGAVGKSSLPVIISTISVSLITAYIACKFFHIPRKISCLIGVGSSICGGSAIAATAPVVGADDEEIAQAISVVFFFNVIAALIFPALGGFLGMTDAGFALFAGTAVNDTSSVTAAASVWDTLHNTNGTVLENATIVKLTRTLAIIPITLCLSLYEAKKDRSGDDQQKLKIGKLIPQFIIWFLVASCITTVIHLLVSGNLLIWANTVFDDMKLLSKFFIVMAMAAIGLNTDIVKLIRTGGKPLLLGGCCWLFISAVSILVQKLLGIW